MTTTRYYLPYLTNSHPYPPPAVPVVSALWNVQNVDTFRVVELATTLPVSIASGTARATSALPLGGRARCVTGVGPALPAGVLSGTTRAVFKVDGVASSGDYYGTMTIRVVSGDGLTERGVLLSVANSPTEAATSLQFRVIGPTALTPVTAQAGDRLVVEWGVHRAPSGGSAFNPGTALGISTDPDSAFVDGGTTSAKGWVELIINDPPSAPTGLEQTAATSTTVDVGWVAPAAGPAPTSYERRTDGGTPVDVGLVTTAQIAGLAPGTAYTIEIRSVAAGGVSSWVSVEATTDEAPPAAEGSTDPRAWHINPESRRVEFPAEDRRWAIPPESRTLRMRTP